MAAASARAGTCIIIALALSAPASAESLADAIALAYQSNPTLQQQRAQLRALNESYVQARAGWRPTVSTQVSGGYTRSPQSSLFGGTSEVSSNAATAALGLTQPLYTGGRTAAQVRVAEANILAGRQTLRATEAALLQNVITAYADVLRDQALLALHERDVALLQSEDDDDRARLQVREVTTTDFAQVENQLAASRSALMTAQGQLQISRAGYAAVVGQNPGRLEDLDDLPGLPATVDEAFTTAEEDNPQLRQAEITEEASRAAIAEAKAANHMTVSANAQIGYTGQVYPYPSGGYQRETSAQIVFTQPLFTGGLNASVVRQAVQQDESNRIGIESARRTTVAAVANAWNSLLTDRGLIASETEHVRVARQYFSGTQAEYTIGQRATLDVIIAEQSVVSAEINLAVAEHDYHVNQAGVLNSIGRLDIHQLAPSVPAYDPADDFRKVKDAGAVPWEGLIGGIDTAMAPDPGPPAAIPAPPIAVAPTVPQGVDVISARTQPASVLPTAPVPNTTAPSTPASLGQSAGEANDSIIRLPDQ